MEKRFWKKFSEKNINNNIAIDFIFVCTLINIRFSTHKLLNIIQVIAFNYTILIFQ